MSTQIAPRQQREFHGVVTSGNPIGRPAGSANRCRDFRVMPGFWLRLRGGRKAQSYTATTIQRIYPFRDVSHSGAANHLAQIKASPSSCSWSNFNLSTYTVDPFIIEPIDLTFDGGYAANNPAAVTNLTDKSLYYNGLGVRDSTSRPPFSTVTFGAIRYFGLDAYAPGGNPSAAFAAGAGNNQVATSVDIWVGLYSSASEHYGNAVFAGKIGATGGLGTITVSSLAALRYASHDAGELGELYYVFYATVDGGKIPYLILNSNLDGPLKVAAGSSSQSLSVASATENGWNLDLTKEAPFDNFPPRPMRAVAFVNQRVYGSLMIGGSGSSVVQTVVGGRKAPDFTYTAQGRELGAVVWSRAAGDVTSTDQLGDPLQSFPLKNIAYTPSLDQPIAIAPAIDNVRVLVITSTSTFLLEEVADGVHEYITISRIHGIGVATTLQLTPYGITWVDQKGQIVMLPPNSLDLVILSANYQNLLTSPARCADYLLDPLNEIDCFRAFLADGTSVTHDFRIGGEGYSSTNQDFTAAQTCVDSSGNRHHLVAKNGIYTAEAQPSTGLIPTTDETWTGPTTTAISEINGEYEANWSDFGDADERKQFWEAKVIGDGADSATLPGSPLAVVWYGDFEEITGANEKALTQSHTPQSLTDSTWSFKSSSSHRFWYKFTLRLRGHHSDDASFATFAPLATQGNLAKNFYGCILRMFFEIGQTSQNRP